MSDASSGKALDGAAACGYHANVSANLTKLDTYIAQRAILNAVERNRDLFHGIVLDVGCGCMPYKSIVASSGARVSIYIGLDLADGVYAKSFGRPDLEWDGIRIPLEGASVDCAISTEVYIQCPDIDLVLAETARVLKPGGLLFFTVPFLWPVHNPPTDQYRFTPFALERHLGKAGFNNIEMQAFGGWDASLAQMIGLWAYRRPMGRIARAIALRVAKPIMRQLMKWDVAPRYPCDDSLMITGISGTARRR